MINGILERAHKLVEKGYTPLLLNGKIPVWGGWQNAIVTLDKVTAWVEDQETGERIDKTYPGLADWKGNYNLGLRTGDNGLVVLDFDGVGGYEAFCEVFPELVHTHTVKTGSGQGYHVYFTVQGDLPASTGQLDMPGEGHVEIKAAGRQVVVPPSIHPDTHQPYTVFVKESILPITSFEPIAQWIEGYQVIDQPEPYYPKVQESHQPIGNGQHEAYAKAALNNIAGQLAGVSEGGRNEALNKAAWKLAHFVRQGDLSESEVRNAMEGAMFSNGLATANGGRKEFEATFQSGFKDGYSDTTWIPEIYTRPARQKRDEWQHQRKAYRAAPGDWQAYNPSPNVVAEDGVQIIGRTRVVRQESLLSDLLERIQDDNWSPPTPPIEFPLKTFWPLGGLARIAKVGRIAGLVGASGSRKTSCLEMFADLYVQAGTPVWIWTPEWNPVEMAERALQRYGGPTIEQLYIQDMDKYRVNVLGLPSDPATRLPENQWQNSAEIFRMIRSWQERVHYVHNTLLTVDELKEVIVEAYHTVKPFPRVMVWDYVQLLKANQVDDQDEGTIYNLIQQLKGICEMYGLFGWVASQTTKDEARRTSKAEGEVFKGSLVFNVTKNSNGRPGKIRLPFDPERMHLYDTLHIDQTFDPEVRYLGSQAARYVNDDAYNLFITLNPEYTIGVTNG